MQKKSLTLCIAGHHFYTEKQGGVEIQTRYIGEILARSGWNVVFLSPSLQGKTGKEDISDNVKVWWYPHFSYLFQTPVTMIENIFDTIQPDVFYQRGRGMLQESGIVLNYARKSSIPYVFALSSDKDLDGLYATKDTLHSFKPLWKRIILIPYSLWLDRGRNKLLKSADCIVVQHEGQNKRVKEAFNRKPYLLRTIHTEIHHEVHKSDKNIILWVTNYRPWKQGELFVRLAGQCKKLNCHFVMIYGRTKKEYIEPVLNESQDKNNITIYREKPPHEVESLIEKSILFINSSLPYEGFPNTFVQSWLRETPVVSLNVNPGGILTKEKIGVHSGSFEKLVKDVAFLVENDEERMAMGKRARTYAEQAHGLEHNSAKIVAFFSSVVNVKR